MTPENPVEDSLRSRLIIASIDMLTLRSFIEMEFLLCGRLRLKNLTPLSSEDSMKTSWECTFRELYRTAPDRHNVRDLWGDTVRNQAFRIM